MAAEPHRAAAALQAQVEWPLLRRWGRHRAPSTPGQKRKSAHSFGYLSGSFPCTGLRPDARPDAAALPRAPPCRRVRALSVGTPKPRRAQARSWEGMDG